MQTLCSDCVKKDDCTTTCKPVEKVLREDGFVFERDYSDRVEVAPEYRCIQMNRLTEDTIKFQFSEEDGIKFNSDALELRTTTVFIERVFNRRSNEEIAEMLGVNPPHIAKLFHESLTKLDEFLKNLDTRRAGIKALKKGKFEFNQPEKFFLLHHVFNFSQPDIAKMFGVKQHVVQSRVEAMAKKYRDLFDGHQAQPEAVAMPPMIGDELVSVVRMYEEKGLSRSDAFRVVAGLRDEPPGNVKARFYSHLKRLEA